MPDFPYALDQLVRWSDGKAIQNMPHKEDRPLNKAERDNLEREGLCIACHKLYSDEDWEYIKKAYTKEGKGALTPQDHDEIVERALKALMEAAKMRREALKLLADANKERP